MSLVYAFAASWRECRTVERAMVARSRRHLSGSVTWGRVGVNEVVLFRTGMGPERARSCAARAILDSQEGGASGKAPLLGTPDAAIVVGLCGGLSPHLTEGDVVLYTECLSRKDGLTRLMCSRPLTDCLAGLLGDAMVHCTFVVGMTGARVVTTPAERLSLGALGADAVDMESYEIIKAAGGVGVPVAVLRVVSDSTDRSMPELNKALLPDGTFDLFRLAREYASKPLAAAGLLAASFGAVRRLGEAVDITLGKSLTLRTTRACGQG